MKNGNKITVMHLRSSLQSSDVLLGGETVVLSICKYLDKNRFLPIIVSIEDLRASPPLPIVEEAGKENIKTEILTLENAFDFRGIFKLVELMRSHGVEILHCHEYKSNLMGFFASIFNKKVKLVTTVHGWTGSNVRLKIYEFFDKFIIRLFKKIIVVSEYQKSLLIKSKINPSAITIIENSIDLDRFKKIFDNSDLKNKLGISHGTLIIGTIGRLSPEKGQGYLIDAFSRLKKLHNKICLLVVGDGPSAPFLKAQVENLKLNSEVVFAGFRKDIPELLSAMDIFVLPSLTEGLPVAILEAMASSKPIVASSVGGVPSLIKQGETGFLSEPKNIDSLCSEIGKLIVDEKLRKILGGRSLEVVKSRFSVQKMAEMYGKLYLDLMGNKSNDC